MEFARLRTCLAGTAAAFLALTACARGEPSLAEVKAGAERYRDVKVAIADGYTTDNKCVTAEMLGFPASMGAMGLHYVRRDLLGLPDSPVGRVRGTGTHTDFRNPAMLVYEPRADGRLTLVAVENLVFAAAWHQAAQNERPPAFHGKTYELLKDDPATKLDEAHNYEPHYERHVWVFRDNPNGVFSPFNPSVTCRHHRAPASGSGDGMSHSSTSQPKPGKPAAI